MSTEVSFAGKFLGLDAGGEHLLMIEVSSSATHTLAFQLDGAFITNLSEGGWLFVEGPRSMGPRRRSALFDDGEHVNSGVEALVSLGVRRLQEADARQEVQAAGHAIYNITAEERVRSRASKLSR